MTVYIFSRLINLEFIMKKVENLKGIIVISKNQQKSINGGVKYFCSGGDRRCCAPTECGYGGGVWHPGAYGYGTSQNCVCY